MIILSVALGFTNFLIIAQIPMMALEWVQTHIESPLLYDLDADIGETTDLAARHPDIVAELLALAESGRQDIGDYNRIGERARFFDSQPRRPDIASK